MGTILASAIIQRAATILFDINGVEWSQTELLEWLNDAQRVICTAIPSAGNVTAVMPLVAGAYQALPTGGRSLIGIYCNMGVNGTTPGRGVRLVSKKLMDAFNPLWQSATHVTVVQNFMLDEMNRDNFWVSPPSDGTGHIQVNYLAPPTDVATLATAISISDTYEPLLLDYLLYRAASKRVDYAPTERAGGYWTAFMDGLAAQGGADVATEPAASPSRTPPAAAPLS